MNAILNYPGAKWGMASKIIGLMPRHRSYLEPFFGSGAVLFNKPPSAIETVNDLDGDITIFFKILRDQTDELIRAISLTPYSREVFDDAHENRGTGDFERAYKFAIRSRMGHGFKTYQKTGFKIDVYARERSYCVSAWNRMPDQLAEAAERLKKVQIENRPALELIRKFNHDNVLIYADPPYLLNTRGGKMREKYVDEKGVFRDRVTDMVERALNSIGEEYIDFLTEVEEAERARQSRLREIERENTINDYKKYMEDT